ncbi:UBP1-associated protein 2C [Dendrobium catenatum]|uniref:Heterogeneous nuclear ribonucleoprotein 1 n=1 Tax=Dendrobium catenatum TaxID=906689 RepID=A0A2I0XB48_9ASPA|nr:UBP1-associated protein 2C [Dendrobium catenatum]XP_020698835.1 UBP1-associated protein 2C [Dendrobium catenatum]XP_028548701.1 UBP1-associated protein 2C [Dendrobium catenatum]PKU85132.1 Heterogeneous nuclear ribonucleoprotein 1 [Dendrobium catenatum]
MDLSSKKRKADDNVAPPLSPSAKLTIDDARKIIESFTQEQLVDIVAEAMCRDSGVLEAVRVIANFDLVQRKLFIRGLGWETTTEKLRSIFSQYGELEEAVVIADKVTGKSKGYGFITFRNIDSALLSLKEPSKKIDGRMTVTQLAASGATGSTVPAFHAADASQRKIFVGNVPADMLSDRLLALFSSYGEIEEGPLGLDKVTGKFRGYALFVYKTVEAAQAALVEPVKSIDGNTLQCKLAIEGKKGRPGTAVTAAGVQGHLLAGTGSNGHGDGLRMGSKSSLPGSISSQFGGPVGGFSSYGGFSGNGVLPGVAAGFGQHHHLNSTTQPSVGFGNAGLPSVGSQTPSSLGGSGAGGYGGGGLSGGPYGSSGQYSGSGGYGGFGMGSSLYRMLPAGSAGIPASGYPESGPYTSSMYQGQHHQPAGSSPGPRVPPGGGMYQNIPHYF